MSRRTLIGLVGCAVVAASAVAIAQGERPATRVVDGARGTAIDFEAMLDTLAHADVVFVGEQHDSEPTHQLELAILQGIAARRQDAILALEMFERDVQEPLDHFQMGHTSEGDFLAVARPWPRYATDYKPLVDFAISKNWPIVASNVPRTFASDVARGGLDVLQSKPADQQAWFAHDLRCPTYDEYFARFAEAMGDHPGAPGSGEATVASVRQTLERTYFAQCLKDETMGESIANAYAAGAAAGAASGGSPLVVHVNGAFHSDFGQGTAARAKRRLPSKRIVVVTILPVDDLNTTPDEKERTRADFLIYTSQKSGASQKSGESRSPVN